LVDPAVADSRGTDEMKRVLFFVAARWVFGQIHFELSKYLHSRSIISDVLDSQRSYTRLEMEMIADYYDYIVSPANSTQILINGYGVSPEKILLIVHAEWALKSRRPTEFDQFAGYGVVSEFLRECSASGGIRRKPSVLPLGINFEKFVRPISPALNTVGYGGKMSRVEEGVEIKRGILAQEAAQAAGLPFLPAGDFTYQAMPKYYGQVDAVLVASTTESFGLVAMEAAAAGRLVVSTPVGYFPYMASQGAGIMAPLEASEYTNFVAEKLSFYKNHPTEYVEACKTTQEAARRFDWSYVLNDWTEFFTNPQ
jgi:glycosyltransferase involved in cell wall biosynthesis